MKKILLGSVFILALIFPLSSSAETLYSQDISLEPGWNIISTPKVLDSHAFSVEEVSDNFDIFVLDASQPSGWATMASLGQSEFTPLYGYFVNNKTGSAQTLTLNYEASLLPNQKLFERTFSSSGWYSIGVANSQYAKDIEGSSTDANNPSQILSLLAGSYDLVVDFTNALFASDKSSVVLSDPWRAAVSSDVNTLNDFRETKGYAIYIQEVGARYNGLQNETVPSEDENENGITVAYTSSTETRTVGSIAGQPDIADFTIKFSVTNNSDDTVYFDGDVTAAAIAAAGNGLTWATTTESTTGTSTTGFTAYSAGILSADSGDGDDVLDSGDKRFVLDAGQTRNFTFTVSIPAGGDNVNIGVKLTGFAWDTTSQDAMANFYNVDLGEFTTDTLTGLYIQ